MNALDVISRLSPFSTWTSKTIANCPAWSFAGRFNEKPCFLRNDRALECAADLALAVRFADEPALLKIADSPAWPELHALWHSLAEIPPPVALALVETECGGLFQLVENAVGRQLSIDGIADEEFCASFAKSLRSFRIVQEDGAEICHFSLSVSPATDAALGVLRNLDTAHETIRETPLEGILILASPVVSVPDLETLSPGDYILLPEITLQTGDGSAPLNCTGAKLVVQSKIAITAGGLEPWTDDGTLKIVLKEKVMLTLGSLLNAASGSMPQSLFPALAAGTPLALMRGTTLLSSGSLATLSGQAAMAVESI